MGESAMRGLNEGIEKGDDKCWREVVDVDWVIRWRMQEYVV